MYPSIIFVSTKQGGILQSSGFLDFGSLMALNRTCKANMIDELSIIQLIENELTRYHGVKTLKEGIDFWRCRCRSPLLKQWLERDSGIAPTMSSPEEAMREAVPYEVMLAKMLQTAVTESELSQLKHGLLHVAAEGDNPESINTVLALYTETELLKVMLTWDQYGSTVLHYVVRSGHHEAIKTLLSVYPETERLQVVHGHTHTHRVTLLHLAAESGNSESIKTLLDLYPESERLRAVSIKNEDGWSVLHCVASSGNPESIRLVLALYPETERLRIVNLTDTDRRTVLHHAAQSGSFESIETVLTLYPEAERLRALNMTTHNGDTVLHCAADSNNIECIKAVLSLYPESERLQALNRRNSYRETALDNMSGDIRDSILEWISQQSESSALKRPYHSTLEATEEVDVERCEAKRQRSEVYGSY